MVRRSRLTRRTLVASALAAGIGTASHVRLKDAHAAPRRAAFGGAAETTIQYLYSDGSGIGASLPALLDRFKAAHPEITVEPRNYAVSPAVMQALQATPAAESNRLWRKR